MEDKKVVMVLGGSSGIGLETLKLFLSDEYIVYNASRSPSPLEDIKNLVVDVSQAKMIEQAIQTIYNEHHRFDILVYCAGFSMASPIEYVKGEDYRYLFEVNLFGVIEACKYVIPIMKEQNYGRIITISSLGGKVVIPYDAYYSASKAALDMLCLELQIELEKYNIYVTNVIPGGVRTNFTFKRRTYNQNEIDGYYDMKDAVKNLALNEQNGLSASDVAMAVYRVIQKKKPPLIVIPGIKNKVYFYFSSLIPKRLMINIVKRVYKTK